MTDDMDRSIELLREAIPHVCRQQYAGKHEQDRIDAKTLYPKIEKFLRQAFLRSRERDDT